jgi:hypothetical protein
LRLRTSRAFLSSAVVSAIDRSQFKIRGGKRIDVREA